MSIPNPILTNIAYEEEGKQTGYLRLPHSVHRSAYGWLPFPVACIRNGEGPTVLLLSGRHVDEYECQVTLYKLFHQLEFLYHTVLLQTLDEQLHLLYHPS